MSDKPRRAWFQIHLSTAVVLMFVAGGLLWANMHERYAETLSSSPIQQVFYGWPTAIYMTDRTVIIDRESTDLWGASRRSPVGWQLEGFALNLVVAIAICTSVVLCFEPIARRREGHAP